MSLTGRVQICVCTFILLPMYVDFSYFFFFNDTATTEIYTLSLHDALPISGVLRGVDMAPGEGVVGWAVSERKIVTTPEDRKSTRLNSSHGYISYAVFCLKKKKNEMSMRTYWKRFLMR